MGKTYPAIDQALERFITAQQMFFVATAPTGPDGHVNLSPKGLDTLRVIDPHTVAYLDYVGSGAETIAHLRENGRIVLMWCAFDGPPKIVRVHGRGTAVEPQDEEFASLRARFGDAPGLRAIIKVHVERLSDSCGFGVPRLAFEGHRSQLTDWATRKGADALVEYQETKNHASIDGLPALRWTGRRGE